MKKWLAAVLCASMVLGTLAGCSGGGNKGSQEQTNAPQAAEGGSETEAAAAESGDAGSEGKEVKLNMMWWTDGAETAAMQKLIDQYESEHPGITIEIQEIAFTDLTQKLQMAISGGEAPALSRSTESTVAALHDAMIDFADYTDGEALRAQYLDSVDYLYMSGDQICALPTEVTANGMIYNKTAFDQAGVEVPTSPDDIWTWDEFKEALKKVVDNSDVQYGMVIDNSTHRWWTMLYEFGGSLLAEKDGKLQGNLSSPESLNAINFTKQLFDEGLAVSSVWLSGEDPNNLFRSGQVAVQIAGTWMIQPYADGIKDFEWGVTYMPIGTTRSSVPGGKGITVFKGTGVEQEAVDFALWVADQQQNEQYCKEAMFVSPRVDNANIEYEVRPEAFAIFADELANTVPAAGIDFGVVGYSTVVGTELNDLWPEVLTGALSPEEMAAECDEISNEYLEENGY